MMFNPEDIIHSYSRWQAITDGVLVDVSLTAREAGIKFHTVLTRRVWEMVHPNEQQIAWGQDYSGRLWDVLYMFAHSARNTSGPLLQYQVLMVLDKVEAEEITLKSVCGPGDEAEPVITIMFPDED